jgi:hypothetical protein
MKNPKDLFRSVIKKTVSQEVKKESEKSLMALGALLCNQQRINQSQYKKLSDFEFKIFSQWGEDGIIQYLVNNVEIRNETFIEFGVENYEEANTKFLLMRNNWSGFVIDSSEKNVESIKNSELCWRHDLKYKMAFITAENINELIKEQNISGEIGILSIDIDGNDYWIWGKIAVVDPVIVIVEYNSVFGKDAAVTTPYDPKFERHKQHYSGLYWGASLGAFIHLAEKKGYGFVGSNSAGNNAFFVRKDRLGNIKTMTVSEGYVESKFRDSRNKDGELDFASGKDRYEKIRGLKVFDVVQNAMISL